MISSLQLLLCLLKSKRSKRNTWKFKIVEMPLELSPKIWKSLSLLQKKYQVILRAFRISQINQILMQSMLRQKLMKFRTCMNKYLNKLVNLVRCSKTCRSNRWLMRFKRAMKGPKKVSRWPSSYNILQSKKLSLVKLRLTLHRLQILLRQQSSMNL